MNLNIHNSKEPNGGKSFQFQDNIADKTDRFSKLTYFQKLSFTLLAINYNNKSSRKHIYINVIIIFKIAKYNFKLIQNHPNQ